MSNLATQIERWVQVLVGETEFITTDDGLEVLNEVYHGMFNPDYRLFGFSIGRNWPEAYAVTDMGVNTTSGTDAYAWLISPIYREEPIVELETTAGSGLYEQIPPAVDEVEWLRMQNASNSRPVVYRRQRSGSTMQIVFAPTPNATGLDIRLRGQTEITKFTNKTAMDGSTTTIFFNEEPDHALAYFIAAKLESNRGNTDRANGLMENGTGLLPATEYMPSRDEDKIIAHYL